MKKCFLIVLIVLTALLLGCSAEKQIQEPEATETPAPTPTATPQMVDMVPAVTETPVPVTPTPTPEPTETPIPFSYYAPTVNMTYEELVGSTDDMKKDTGELCKDGFPASNKYYIIVDKYWQVVLVYMRKAGANEPDYDRPVRYMLCSTGNPKSEYGHETQNGTWQIDLPRERFWQFVNLEAAQYLTCIHSRTYFHSVLYKTRADLSTLIKDSYDNLGKKASHACVRLTVPDSRWIYYNIAPGTTCLVTDGSAKDERTAAIRAQLILPPSKSGVRLSAKDYLWTDNWSIDDVEHEVAYKYMKPKTPEGYDENGNKIETNNGNGGDTGGTTPVEDVPVPDNGDSGNNGGGGSSSDGDYEPVYVD